MKTIVMFTAAAVGALAVVAAESASAKPLPKQSFSCRLSKGGVFRDGIYARNNIAMVNVGVGSFFNYALGSGAFKISGITATSSIWLLPCLSTKDIRTPGVLPLTFRPGGSDDTVAGTFGVTRGESVIGSWVTDENNPNSFSVVFKSYNATTGRLVGTFGGTLAPGDFPAGQKPNKVTGGRFNVSVDFHGF